MSNTKQNLIIDWLNANSNKFSGDIPLPNSKLINNTNLLLLQKYNHRLLTPTADKPSLIHLNNQTLTCLQLSVNKKINKQFILRLPYVTNTNIIFD